MPRSSSISSLGEDFFEAGPAIAEEATFIGVGIDFGTTFSGATWAWSGDPKNEKHVTRWPDGNNTLADNAKAPTVVSYESQYMRWGYGVQEEAHALRWFKLLLVDPDVLDEKIRESDRLQEAAKALKKTGKDVVEVVADYLRQLWNLILQDMEMEYGAMAVVNQYPFRVVLTVPAIWTASANEKMKLAAQQAGITAYRQAGQTTLNLVPEPEAAALATLNETGYVAGVGDIFVICDVGGGTADLISYKIESTRPMKVRECVEGKGKLCGAIFVDEAFKRYMGVQLSSSMWKRLTEDGVEKLMSKEWEVIKRKFDGKEGSWSVELPIKAFRTSVFGGRSLKGRGVDDGALKLSTSTVKSFFDKPLSQIKGLVSEQVHSVARAYGKPPKGILLVGGFGCCQYLRKELCEQYVPKKINVHQSSNTRPWIAIARGALVKALEMNDPEHSSGIKVTSRVSRVSYGIKYNQPYDKDRHRKEEREWCQDEGRYMVKDRMRWYLKKGQDVQDSKSVSLDWYRLLRQPLKDGKWKVILWQTDEDDPPRVKNSKVQPLCDIECRLRSRFEDLKPWTNPQGEFHRKMEYEIHMFWDGTTLDWEVYVKGQSQGHINTAVQFADGTEKNDSGEITLRRRFGQLRLREI